MSNIDFLHNAGSDDGGKKKNSKKQEIKWSKPSTDNMSSVGIKQKNDNNIGSLEKKPGFFSRIFSKPKKSIKEAPLETPIVFPTAVMEEKKVATQAPEKRIESAPEESSWHNPEILETNLIKDEIISFFDWKKNILVLSFFVFLSLAIIGVAYFWLDSWGKRKEAENLSFVNDFAKLQSEIRTMDRELQEAVVFKKKLSLVKDLLDNHIYWTNFFDFLEKNTVEDVYYTGGFKGGRSDQYSMSAQTSSFNVVAEQVRALRQNDIVLDVSVSSGTLKSSSKEEGGGDMVDFTLNFVINPSVFIK